MSKINKIRVDNVSYDIEDTSKEALTNKVTSLSVSSTDTQYPSAKAVVDYVGSSVPTATSDLTNDSGFIDNTVNDLTNYTLTSNLSSVATSGDYDDLTNKPTIPTALSDLTNDNDTVQDSNYVHTDNNYTTTEKNKLSGIETGAQENVIESVVVNGTTATITNKVASVTIQTGAGNIDSISVNGTPQTIDANKNVDITVPTKVSDLTNDSGFIDNTVNNLTNYTLTSNLSTVATSGDYDDLSNKPTIPTNVSDLNNDSGFIDNTVNNLTNYTLTSNLATVATSGDYTDLSNTPTIPTNVSDLTNDSGFIDNTVNDLTNYTKTADLATVATSGDYDDLTNKPTIPDVSNFITKDVNNLTYYTKTADLASVATSGSYNDLSNTPSIPTATSDLTNDSGFIDNTVNDLVNYTLTSNLATVATSGDYTDLSNTPTIPSATSDLTNDSGYITNTVNNLTNYTKTSDLATVATSGDYDDLTNKPTLFSGDYDDLTNKPSIPDSTSDLTNDSGFIDNTVNNLTNYTLATSTGSTIDVSINSSTYVMTIDLKNSAGTTISTDTVDLPIESMVVNATYDNTNKKIVLTLQSGSTIDVPVGDLVSGLQTEITSQSKLSADLVDDTNTTNKFVTASDITNWNAKSDFSGSYNDLTDKPTIPDVSNFITKDVNDLTYYTKTSDLASVATSGDYEDLINLPDIPKVYDITTSSSSFFVFNDADPGIYYNKTTGGNINYKISSDDSSYNNITDFYIACIIINKNYNDADTDEVFGYLVGGKKLNTGENTDFYYEQAGRYQGRQLKKTSNGISYSVNVSISGNTLKYITDDTQLIKGVKRFYNVPECDTLATNNNQLVNKNYVNTYTVQTLTTMPTASSTYRGMIVQYKGTTDSNYTNGYFYKCVYENNTDSWVRIDVQPNETIQYMTMPTASSSLVGAIVQYIGANTSTYTNGYFYKCVSDGAASPTYSWEQVNVQDASPRFDYVIELEIALPYISNGSENDHFRHPTTNEYNTLEAIRQEIVSEVYSGHDMSTYNALLLVPTNTQTPRNSYHMALTSTGIYCNNGGFSINFMVEDAWEYADSEWYAVCIRYNPDSDYTGAESWFIEVSQIETDENKVRHIDSSNEYSYLNYPSNYALTHYVYDQIANNRFDYIIDLTGSNYLYDPSQTISWCQAITNASAVAKFDDIISNLVDSGGKIKPITVALLMTISSNNSKPALLTLNGIVDITEGTRSSTNCQVMMNFSTFGEWHKTGTSSSNLDNSIYNDIKERDYIVNYLISTNGYGAATKSIMLYTSQVIREDTGNKVTSMTNNISTTQYPSTYAVSNFVANEVTSVYNTLKGYFSTSIVAHNSSSPFIFNDYVRGIYYIQYTSASDINFYYKGLVSQTTKTLYGPVNYVIITKPYGDASYNDIIGSVAYTNTNGVMDYASVKKVSLTTDLSGIQLVYSSYSNLKYLNNPAMGNAFKCIDLSSVTIPGLNNDVYVTLDSTTGQKLYEDLFVRTSASFDSNNIGIKKLYFYDSSHVISDYSHEKIEFIPIIYYGAGGDDYLEFNANSPILNLGKSTGMILINAVQQSGEITGFNICFRFFANNTTDTSSIDNIPATKKYVDEHAAPIYDYIVELEKDINSSMGWDSTRNEYTRTPTTNEANAFEAIWDDMVDRYTDDGEVIEPKVLLKIPVSDTAGDPFNVTLASTGVSYDASDSETLVISFVYEDSYHYINDDIYHVAIKRDRSTNWTIIKQYVENGGNYVDTINATTLAMDRAYPSVGAVKNYVDAAVPDGMTILSYGHSTWADFIAAYQKRMIVYCRASSGSNPGSGSQTRMAFMAYVNNAESPTEVEFQYYRSVSSHSASQQGDQTYVYKLNKTNGWSVTVRENYSKVIAGTGLTSSYSNSSITLAVDGTPVNTSAQTFSGVKTFNSLPECSVTPTTNNQLVNKAYVDSVAGGDNYDYILDARGIISVTEITDGTTATITDSGLKAQIDQIISDGIRDSSDKIKDYRIGLIVSHITNTTDSFMLSAVDVHDLSVNDLEEGSYATSYYMDFLYLDYYQYPYMIQIHYYQDGPNATKQYTYKAIRLPNKSYVDTQSATKITQYITMPTASSSNNGQIVQYKGTTTANYINGYFYKCVSDGVASPTYSWEAVNVQAGTAPTVFDITSLGSPLDQNVTGFYEFEINKSESSAYATIYNNISANIKKGDILKFELYNQTYGEDYTIEAAMIHKTNSSTLGDIYSASKVFIGGDLSYGYPIYGDVSMHVDTSNELIYITIDTTPYNISGNY